MPLRPLAQTGSLTQEALPSGWYWPEGQVHEGAYELLSPLEQMADGVEVADASAQVVPFQTYPEGMHCKRRLEAIEFSVFEATEDVAFCG